MAAFLNERFQCVVVEHCNYEWLPVLIIIPIFFSEHQINDACVVSDLGIEINSTLKNDAHINTIVGKAYSRIGVLFKAFTTRHVPVLKKRKRSLPM